jgi:hypothetical protein
MARVKAGPSWSQRAAARERGLSKDEIYHGARTGDYCPEKIPDDILLPEVY